MLDLLTILVSVMLAAGGIILLILGYRARLKGQALLTQAKKKLKTVQKEIEDEKREAGLKLKE